MNKIKQIVKFSALALLSGFMAIGGAFLFKTTTPQTNAQVINETVQNSLPVFFNKENSKETYFFNDATEASDYASFKFDFELALDADSGKSIYRYYPDEMNKDNYCYIDNLSFSISINGQEISLATNNISDLVLTSADPTYFDSTIYPKSADFKIKLDVGRAPVGANAEIDPKTESSKALLTLYEEGLLNINFRFDLYNVTRANSPDISEIVTVSTNQNYSYSVLLLNKTKYFEQVGEAPSINYPIQTVTRTPSGNSLFGYNYFYNYTSSTTGSVSTFDLPFIEYDPMRFELTITKNLNNSTSSATILFNPETLEYNKPDFVYDVVFKDGKIKVYFNNLGLYSLHYNLIYTYQGQTDTNFHIYDISPSVLDQRFYVYGAQMSYTSYSESKFVEFKKINDSHQIEQSADITYMLERTNSNGDFLTATDVCDQLPDYSPVKTDQTPVKLSTFANNLEAKLYKKDNNGVWSAGEPFTITQNLSEDGIYILAISYKFANYTNNSGVLDTNQSFYQYFYFQIQKQTPSIKVENTENQEIYSGQYTNGDVKITFDNNNGVFDSEVYIDLIQRNYSTGQLIRQSTIFPNSQSVQDWTTGENGAVTIPANDKGDGRYTIEIYYGKDGRNQPPITRTFTIDTQPIDKLQAYTINTNITGFARESAFGNVTNQPFVFSWENIKDSGASTYGYMKYFPLEDYNDFYPSETSGQLLASLIASENKMIATTKQLTLNTTNANWTSYINASIYPDKSIASNCVRQNAGLYIFQIFDQAGNSKASYVFYDNSSPLFVLQTETGYSLLTTNETLNTNATLYWGQYKGIYLNFEDSDYESQNIFSSDFTTNINGDDDETLKEVFQNFIGSDLAPNIKNVTLNAGTTNRSGLYYFCKIDDTIAFKDRESETPIDTNLGTYYELQFSYSIYYTQTSRKFYKSTSSINNYVDMATGETVLAINGQINGENLTPALILQNGKEFFYGYENAETVINIKTGQSFALTYTDNNYYVTYNAQRLLVNQVDFVDMEGTYSFMLRDSSNTKGMNLPILDRLTNYPSAVQYISLSGDSSQTQVLYTEENDTKSQLFLSSYYQNGRYDDDVTTFRYSNYNPTSYQGALILSFTPTVENTQIDTVTLSYYPFETKCVANRKSDDTANISFYRTISSTPSINNEILYSFEQSGANENTIIQEINLNKSLTQEGKYVITRTYKTGEGYTVDQFDYTIRTLTFIVDRNNVIISPETVSVEAKTYKVVDDEEEVVDDEETVAYEITTYANLIIITAKNDYPLPSGAKSSTSAVDGEALFEIYQKNETTAYDNTYFNEVNSYNINDSFYIFMPEGFDFGSMKIYYKDAILSSTEASDTKTNTALESLIGGDIFVNMYDNAKGLNVSVSFPYIINMLPSGDTLFSDAIETKEDWEKITLNAKFYTNKLPVYVYIPQYKFTKYNKENLSELPSTEYESIENSDMSYYNINDKSSVITSYQLYAEITALTTDGLTTSTTTYHSNGADENGYLKFIDSTGTPVEKLTQPGTYTVRIVQNNNGSGIGTANNFTKEYRFAFEIESASPEFDLSTTGKTLENAKNTQNYYTNQRSFSATWQDANSIYMANIDKTQIRLSFPLTANPDIIVDVSNPEELTAKLSNGGTSEFSKKVESALTFISSNNTSVLTLNLESAGLYYQNSNISITMQFEEHNDNYYQKTTKNVSVDIQASTSSINSLINKIKTFSSGSISFNEQTLREFYNTNGTKLSSSTNAPFNVSISNGNLKYYAYLVDESFFTNLYGEVTVNSSSGLSYNGDAVRVYYQKINDNNPYTGDYVETSYDNFAESDFSILTDISPFSKNTYYEIVEQDIAGNMTIYIVYLYDEDTKVEDSRIDQGLTFEDGERIVKFSDSQLLAQTRGGKEISLYSTTNFILNQLNLLGDRWNTIQIVKTNSSNQTETVNYMLTPWYQGFVIDMKTGERIAIEDIFKGYSSSSTPLDLTISDKANGNSIKALLYLLDSVSLIASHTNSITSEALLINQTSIVFPVEVKVILSGYNIDEKVYFYECTNDPNSLENLSNANYNQLTSWLSDDNINYSYTLSTTLTQLNFNFNALPNLNDKVKYQITDNFGNTITLIHIFGMSEITEITSSGNLYEDLINDSTISGTDDFFTSYVSATNVSYNYNPNIYSVIVEKFSNNNWEKLTLPSSGTSTTDNHIVVNNGNVKTISFKRLETDLTINNNYKVIIYEIPDDEETWDAYNAEYAVLEEQYVKEIYIHLYDMRPTLNKITQPGQEPVSEPHLTLADHYGENVTNILEPTTSSEYLKIGNRQWLVSEKGQTFALNLTVTYSNSPSFYYPYEVLYYNQEKMTGFEYLQSGSLLSESGIYYILVRYVNSADDETPVLTNEYNLYKVEILDSSSKFYRVTNNGVDVQSANTYYNFEYENKQYSDYYIVNVNYNTNAAAIEIVPNTYQNIVVYDLDSNYTIVEGNGVITVGKLVTNYTIYPKLSPPSQNGISPFFRYVFITYVPPTTTPVSSAVYYFNQNEMINILNQSSINAIIPNENQTQDTVTIRWSKNYGISANEIYINVLKDGVQFFSSNPTTTTTEAKNLVAFATTTNYNSITLNRSGTYTISFTDQSGNSQIFASNSKNLQFVFLKDVAFSMTYTDQATGQEVVSDPINKGVFNGDVKLKILNMSSYYSATSTGSGESIIRASKNGVTLTSFDYDASTQTFTFTEPGYYSVYFIATSQSGINVRQQTYNFTIINPNESRYSYEFAPYQNFYIKEVIKDNLGDITTSIISNPSLNLQTINIDGKTYLKELVTSYIGTGSGRYTITLATNSYFNRTDYSQPTELTFSYWINTATVPMDISIVEGSSSSSPISVVFNAERVYQAVGECTITIGNYIYHITGENASSFGVVNAPSLENTGTYYITVHSMSGNLLFSYKVIKTEPLNGWAIAAIVIGCVVVIVAVFLVIKLRKRIRVK